MRPTDAEVLKEWDLIKEKFYDKPTQFFFNMVIQHFDWDINEIDIKNALRKRSGLVEKEEKNEN